MSKRGACKDKVIVRSYEKEAAHLVVRNLGHYGVQARSLRRQSYYPFKGEEIGVPGCWALESVKTRSLSIHSDDKESAHMLVGDLEAQ